MARQLTNTDICFASAPLHPDPSFAAQPLAESPVFSFGPALAQARRLPRACLPFRAVNLRDTPGYDPGVQRHHLLPKQVLSARCFGHLFDQIGLCRIGFDDFRSNGLLLPASENAAIRIGLPLHRGPHNQYNALVLERVGQVEAGWSSLRLRAPEIALDEALMRLRLLQAALRRRLLDPGTKRLSLNRFDPLGREADFSHMDAMVEALWPATQPVEGRVDSDRAPEFLAENANELALIAPSTAAGDGPERPLSGTQPAVSGARSAFAFKRVE